MIRRLAASGAALALLAFAAAGPALAAPGPSPTPPTSVSGPLTVAGSGPEPGVRPVMLLLDTSGSMNDDDGTGHIKIAGARQALIDFSRSVPAGTPVGVRHFPAGNTTDSQGCSTGSLVVGLQPIDTPAVDATIRSLQANGETPTAAALTAAAGDIKAAGYTSGTIVLVSDGLANCGDDPCTIAKGLSAKGVDVAIDTVGFRVEAEGRKSLQCIASAGGGQYADVGSNAGLIAALNSLTTPRLTIDLQYPKSVRSAVGSNASGLATITGQVTNTSALTVHDAVAALQFTGPTAPALLVPRHRLGNLAPGESVQVDWPFRPPFTPPKPVVAFSASVQAADSAPVSSSGQLALDAQFTRADAGPILTGAHDVAILGDSYSAGEGAGQYDPTTATATNSCHRSQLTYAVALWPAGQVHNFACSGALSQAIGQTNTSNRSEPAQVDHLERHAYDLALMTIGGNDLGFTDIVGLCAVMQHCEGPGGPGAFTNARLQALPNTLHDTYALVDSTLNDKANLVRRNGRVAPLLVLAYPDPVPLAAGLRYVFCSLEFTPLELQFLQSVVTRLNDAARSAAALLRSEGKPVYFVDDTEDALQPDHHYCSAEPYINRLSPRRDALAALNLLTSQLILRAGALSPLTVAALAVTHHLADTPGAVKLAQEWHEQVHPNANGYAAENVELVRWSVSAAARVPVTRSDVPSQIPVTVANPQTALTVVSIRVQWGR